MGNKKTNELVWIGSSAFQFQWKEHQGDWSDMVIYERLISWRFPHPTGGAFAADGQEAAQYAGCIQDQGIPRLSQTPQFKRIQMEERCVEAGGRGRDNRSHPESL